METGELTVQDRVLVEMEDVVNLIQDNVYVLQVGREFIVKILVTRINLVQNVHNNAIAPQVSKSINNIIYFLKKIKFSFFFSICFKGKDVIMFLESVFLVLPELMEHAALKSVNAQKMEQPFAYIPRVNVSVLPIIMAITVNSIAHLAMLTKYVILNLSNLQKLIVYVQLIK